MKKKFRLPLLVGLALGLSVPLFSGDGATGRTGPGSMIEPAAIEEAVQAYSAQPGPETAAGLLEAAIEVDRNRREDRHRHTGSH